MWNREVQIRERILQDARELVNNKIIPTYNIYLDISAITVPRNEFIIWVDKKAYCSVNMVTVWQYYDEDISNSYDKCILEARLNTFLGRRYSVIPAIIEFSTKATIEK